VLVETPSPACLRCASPPALCNDMVERFIALVEANRWGKTRSALGGGLVAPQ